MIGTMAKLRRSMLVAVIIGAVLSVAAGLVGTSLECYLCAWWKWLLVALLATLPLGAGAGGRGAGWLGIVGGCRCGGERSRPRPRRGVRGAGDDAAAVGRSGCHGAVTGRASPPGSGRQGSRRCKDPARQGAGLIEAGHTC